MEFRGNEQTAYDLLTFKSRGKVFTRMKLIALDIAETGPSYIYAC